MTSAYLNQGCRQVVAARPETQAQRWKKDLAHSAGIITPAGIVQTLKTWQRRPIETKLGIIVIL